MKRWLGILLAALLLLPLLPARGEEMDSMPQELLSWMEQQGIPREETGPYLLFSLPDGSEKIVWASRSDELTFWDKVDGQWTYVREWDTGLNCNVKLERQDPERTLPDGSHAPDDLGFRVTDGEAYIDVSWTEEGGLQISGWAQSGYDGCVMVREGIASFYPRGSTAPEAQVDVSAMPLDQKGLYNFPATPIQAADRAKITQAALAGYFPGYTLRDYSAHWDLEYTQVAYSRVENGLLYIK